MRWALLIFSKIADSPRKVAVMKTKNPSRPEKDITERVSRMRMIIESFL